MNVEVSLTQAADVLGVSERYLTRLLAEKQLTPASTPQRVRLQDVLRYKSKRHQLAIC